MFEFKQKPGNQSLNLFLRLSKASSTPGDSHSTAGKTELTPLCTFPVDILLTGFTEDEKVPPCQTFLGEIQGCTAVLRLSETSSSRLLGEAAQAGSAFGKRDYVGVKPWVGFFFFLRCLMGNQISTLQRKEGEVALISNTLCKDCYQAFQKYLDFLLGSNFCFL